MDDMKLYWTMIVGLVTAVWAVATFLRDRAAQAFERTSQIMAQLHEGDRIILDNPAIQRYLSEHAEQEEAYFRTPSVPDEDVFYKAKTLVYWQLNMFDEILSMSARTSKKWWLMKPAALIEIEDWKTYMKAKLRHPLYRYVLKNESEIFGRELRSFWRANRKAIESSPANPFMW